MSGILGIAPVYNKNFSRLLSYYNIKVGPESNWGIGLADYGYYSCQGYKDQCNLYRLQRCLLGGLSAEIPMFGDLEDITDSLVLPFKMHHSVIWSRPDYIADDFELVLHNTVKYYESITDHVSILYSGGVDSTTVVCAFIKSANKDNFTIAYTSESIAEYPLMWDYIVKNNYNVVNVEDISLSSLPGIIIDGNPDYGVWNADYCKDSVLYDSWEKIINPAEWSNYSEIIEFGRRYMQHYGKDNPTVADLNIYLDYYVRNIRHTHLHYDQKLSPDRLLSFYDSSWCNSWTYYHAAKYLLDSHLPARYKLPNKLFINDVVNDGDYLRNKAKNASRHLWRLKCNVNDYLDGNLDYFFIDYTGERVRADSLAEYRSKYGTRFDHYFGTT